MIILMYRLEIGDDGDDDYDDGGDDDDVDDDDDLDESIGVVEIIIISNTDLVLTHIYLHLQFKSVNAKGRPTRTCKG